MYGGVIRNKYKSSLYLHSSLQYWLFDTTRNISPNKREVVTAVRDFISCL